MVAHGIIVACSDDPLIGDLMHPRRKEYPSDFVAYFRKKFLRTLPMASHHHIVTYEMNDGRENITGYAEWHRRRAGDKEPHADTTARGEQSARNVASKDSRANSLADTSDNRAANPAYADVLERASVFTQGYWMGARAETWYLDLLMVDPSHQRKGLGRRMVLYGVDRADEEGVCASVIGSEAGDGLYASCGFQTVGRMQEGEGNPLRDVPGGRIFFREPQTTK